MGVAVQSVPVIGDKGLEFFAVEHRGIGAVFLVVLQLLKGMKLVGGECVEIGHGHEIMGKDLLVQPHPQRDPQQDGHVGAEKEEANTRGGVGQHKALEGQNIHHGTPTVGYDPAVGQQSQQLPQGDGGKDRGKDQEGLEKCERIGEEEHILHRICTNPSFFCTLDRVRLAT